MEDLAMASKGELLPADETELLLHYLKTHDAVCPLCKYNLRNLTVPRCPECGRAIRITVGLVEPHIRWYIMLLIAVLAPMGVSPFAWISILQDGLHLYRAAPWLVIIAMTGFALSVFPAIAGIVFRRRFLRLELSRQRIVAAGAVGVTVLLYGMLIWALVIHPTF